MPGLEPFKIDFVAVGPPRTGTTWLDVTLRAHPDIDLPKKIKETFFLDRHFDKGTAWYASLFEPAKTAAAVQRGEVAPSYFHFPDAPERLRDIAPKCKIIVTMREPVSQSTSLFQHHFKKGRIPPNFREAVRAIPEIEESAEYSRHLPRWFQTFGRDRVLVMVHEEVRADPAASLRTILDFIGVRSDIKLDVPTEEINSASVPRSRLLALAGSSVGKWLHAMNLHGVANVARHYGRRFFFEGGSAPLPRPDDQDVERLQQHFSKDVAYVGDLLGRPVSAWQKA